MLNRFWGDKDPGESLYNKDSEDFDEARDRRGACVPENGTIDEDALRPS